MRFSYSFALKRRSTYSSTPVTRTLKGNEKQFELAGNSNHQGKFKGNFDQGNGNLVRVSEELPKE